MKARWGAGGRRVLEGSAIFNCYPSDLAARKAAHQPAPQEGIRFQFSTFPRFQFSTFPEFHVSRIPRFQNSTFPKPRSEKLDYGEATRQIDKFETPRGGRMGKSDVSFKVANANLKRGCRQRIAARGREPAEGSRAFSCDFAAHLGASTQTSNALTTYKPLGDVRGRNASSGRWLIDILPDCHFARLPFCQSGPRPKPQLSLPEAKRISNPEFAPTPWQLPLDLLDATLLPHSCRR